MKSLNIGLAVALILARRRRGAGGHQGRLADDEGEDRLAHHRRRQRDAVTSTRSTGRSRCTARSAPLPKSRGRGDHPGDGRREGREQPPRRSCPQDQKKMVELKDSDVKDSVEAPLKAAKTMDDMEGGLGEQGRRAAFREDPLVRPEAPGHRARRDRAGRSAARRPISRCSRTMRYGNKKGAPDSWGVPVVFVFGPGSRSATGLLGAPGLGGGAPQRGGGDPGRGGGAPDVRGELHALLRLQPRHGLAAAARLRDEAARVPGRGA